MVCTLVANSGPPRSISILIRRANAVERGVFSPLSKQHQPEKPERWNSELSGMIMHKDPLKYVTIMNYPKEIDVKHCKTSIYSAQDGPGQAEAERQRVDAGSLDAGLGLGGAADEGPADRPGRQSYNDCVDLELIEVVTFKGFWLWLAGDSWPNWIVFEDLDGLVAVPSLSHPHFMEAHYLATQAPLLPLVFKWSLARGDVSRQGSRAWLILYHKLVELVNCFCFLCLFDCLHNGSKYI